MAVNDSLDGILHLLLLLIDGSGERRLEPKHGRVTKGL
jgi:hypothetical protein